MMDPYSDSSEYNSRQFRRASVQLMPIPARRAQIRYSLPNEVVANTAPIGIAPRVNNNSGSEERYTTTSAEMILSPFAKCCRDYPSRSPKQLQWKQESRVKLYGVREDFYSTLITSHSSWIANPWESIPMETWNTETRRLAQIVSQETICFVNYEYKVQTWSKQLGHQKIPDPIGAKVRFPIFDTATCIAHSKLGYMIVGYLGGRVLVRDALDHDRIAVVSLSEAIGEFERDYFHESLSGGNIAPNSAYLSHVVWCHKTPDIENNSVSIDGDDNHVYCSRMGFRIEGFLGDHLGRVFKFAIAESRGTLDLKFKIVAVTASEKFHADSVCSMALNTDEASLAVAGTDNMVRIWQHDYSANDASKVLQFDAEIPQFSAVRAIGFCPVIPNMLVTGGGRHDRVLRVFHTNVKKAMCEIYMPAQIVGIVWLSKIEIFVALGHSRVKKYRGFGKVVNVLTGQILAEIAGDGYLLTALKTQTGFCVNTSYNDLITFTWKSDSCTARLTAGDVKASYSLSSPTPQLR